MIGAYFAVRQGVFVAGNMMTAHGPFESKDALLAVAPSFPPGNYTIFGPADSGDGFAISMPQFTLIPAEPQGE